MSAGELLEHAGFLARLARELTRDPHRASDVVQSTWLAALERPPRDASSLRGWLAIVARNAARAHRRGEARRAEREARASSPEACEPDLALERIELQRVLFDLVLALPPDLRTVLYLRYYEGSTPTVIAERLAVPIKTVKSRLTRALTELRARLDARANGDRTMWVSALLPLVRSDAAGFSTGALAALAGGLAMKKMMLVACAIVIAIFVWQSTRAIAPDDAPRTVRSVTEEPTDSIATTSQELATTADAAVDERRAEGGLPAPTTMGALEVKLAWSDGSPAANVSLSATCHEDPAPREESFSTSTDATGVAVLAELFSGHVTLILDRGWVFHAQVTAGTTTRVELAIPDGVEVEGTVVAPDGAPVANAQVWVQGARRDWPTAVRLATTAPDGTFRLRDLEVDACMGARAVGYLPSIFTFEAGTNLREGEVRAVTLVLGGPGGRIQGRVLAPDGRPLSRARVMAGPRGGEFVNLPSGMTGLTPDPIPVATNSDGSFTLPGDLAAGVQPIFAVARGFPIWEGSIEVVEGRTTFLEIRLEPPATIEGRVVTTSGELVAGAEVIAAREERGGYYWHPFPPPRTTSGADGKYELGWVAPGARELRAHSPEIPRLGRAHRVVECAPEAVTECDLVLQPGRTISGRVVDSAERPLEGWTVYAQARAVKGAYYPRHDSTDASGGFVVTDLAEGTHDLLVVAPGEWISAPRERVRSVPADSRDVVLVVDRVEVGNGVVRGILRQRDGQVPSDVRLLLQPVGGMTSQTIEFDAATGAFVAYASVGPNRLVAMRDKIYLARTDAFEIVADGSVDLGIFELDPPGRLEVEVTGCPPEELSRLRFRLNARDWPSASLELIDGVLRSKDIAPRLWSIELDGAELFLRGGMVEVPAGQTVRVGVVVERGFPVVLACRDPLPRMLEIEARAPGARGDAQLLVTRRWLDDAGQARVILPDGPVQITVRTDDGRATALTLHVGPALISSPPTPIEPR